MGTSLFQTSHDRLRMIHSAVKQASIASSSSQRFQSGYCSALDAAMADRAAGRSPGCGLGPVIELSARDPRGLLQILMIGGPLAEFPFESRPGTGSIGSASLPELSIHARYGPTRSELQLASNSAVSSPIFWSGTRRRSPPGVRQSPPATHPPGHPAVHRGLAPAASRSRPAYRPDVRREMQRPVIAQKFSPG